MPRSFVEIDVLLPLADREDALNTCSAVRPYLEGKDCRVHVIHVSQATKNLGTSTSDRAAEEIFTVARECFEAVDIPVSTAVYHGQDVATVILDAAAEYSADSIILTPRERSVWRKLVTQDVLGSLATATEQPLIIVPNG